MSGMRMALGVRMNMVISRSCERHGGFGKGRKIVGLLKSWDFIPRTMGNHGRILNSDRPCVCSRKIPLDSAETMG